MAAPYRLMKYSLDSQGNIITILRVADSMVLSAGIAGSPGTPASSTSSGTPQSQGVPPSPGWHDFQLWLLAGNTPDPVPVPTLTPQQQAATLLTSGTVSVTSTATPALNGTYAVDPNSRSNIIAVQTRINAGLGLPGGGTTFSYYDTSGAAHQFGTGDFTNFAKAVSDYVYELSLVASGASQTLPANTLTIA